MPQIRIAFAYFWPGFNPSAFKAYFPYVFEKYDLVLSKEPEVVFYSAFSPQYRFYADQRFDSPEVRIPPGKYLRVFFTGENYEPAMADCEFAITFSALTDHPNHLRLPLWVYENRGWGHAPENLVRSGETDWEKIAREKTGFANFVYSQEIPFRNRLFDTFNAYKRVDAAGPCLNNMNGWCVPQVPNRLAGKLQFLSKYKFTLAFENAIWPGYCTEKLVDPMFAHSVPIYLGDPTAKLTFNPDAYIDLSNFATMREALEFVREADTDSGLYLKLLSAPVYRENRVPEFAREQRVAAFFDRIFEAALARR